MTDPPRRRRPRYRGTHPRRHEEKYKELDPERYPEIVPVVRARGQTPAGSHVPILVEEVLAALDPRPGERGVDATLGWGGHAQRVLERLRPGGQLLGLDADGEQLPRTEARLRALGYGEAELVTRRSSFAGLSAALAALGWEDGADFLLADLGVSSMQLDDPARGFSLKHDGPLDMRLNQAHGVSAARWLAGATVARIEAALTDYADEPQAALLAQALHARRDELQTTLALAELVRRTLAGRAEPDEVERAVRRVFQALRIAVNDELGALDALLRQLPGCLRSGGRVAFLTFHSGEDRRVKHAFREGARAGVYAEVSADVVRAGPAERRDNPRAKPAKLRWVRRA
ncbi:MAG: 16S rRNA (cytosine(1402)-N(4))-methyltransferase RsmH [Planctomycetota bacterium]